MCTLNKPLKIPAVQLVLKYSQPPTFLNLRGHSSNLSVEVLTQLPFHTCGILCSLDTTQHVPMFPAGRVSMVTRILHIHQKQIQRGAMGAIKKGVALTYFGM